MARASSKRSSSSSSSTSRPSVPASASAGKLPNKQGGPAKKIALPGEKSVRATRKSVAVKPANRSDVPARPTDPAAIDHRRQIVGTDDPKDRTSRRGKPS